MKVDNQTTRNARKRGEITQEQARRLLEAAETAVHWQMGNHMDACASQPTWLSGAPTQGACDCWVGTLEATIREIRGE
jgi:hypothetical protein